jgi:hypothetical protein
MIDQLRGIALQEYQYKKKEELEIKRLDYLITKTDFYKKIMEKLEK